MKIGFFFGFSLPAKIKQKSSTCLKFLIAMVTMCCTYYPLWKQRNSIFFLLLRFCDFSIPYFYYPYRLLLLKIPSWPPIHICTSVPIQTFEDCPVLAEFSNTWRGMQQYRLILTFFNTPRPKNKYLEKTGKLHLRLGTVISLMDWRTKLRFCLLQKFSPQTAVLQFTHV